MKNIAIIGYGNMGSAIAQCIRDAYAVAVFDKDASKTEGVKCVAVVLVDLVEAADAIILAVKPQDFDAVLAGIKDAAKNKLVISIAAGITTGYIEKMLPGARVVRVMPNLAAKIAEAESAICKGVSASAQDLAFARELFDKVGKTWIMAEEMIDSATAISGSGPAYLFYDMEKNGIAANSISLEKRQEYAQRLSQAAKKVGFDPAIAFELADATVTSSISLCVKTSVLPAELRIQVTSKGGTTAAALDVLEKGGSWPDAAVAAKKRAGELSK